eukprot:TRINITY_DN23471_c0_g1_i1.p1 TRINITY_DN23471_c0_g1~~TRINITY_DN23471_c0_g1_i1.p1  ORF type:complete len:300 (+),score=54.02 TRINITY_DN23471_c0_g1_i1:154-1053(+)
MNEAAMSASTDDSAALLKENARMRKEVARREASLLLGRAPPDADVRSANEQRRRGLALLLASGSVSEAPPPPRESGISATALAVEEARNLLRDRRRFNGGYVDGTEGGGSTQQPTFASHIVRSQIVASSELLNAHVTDLSGRVDALEAQNRILSREKEQENQRLAGLRDAERQEQLDAAKAHRREVEGLSAKLVSLDAEALATRAAAWRCQVRERATVALARALRDVLPLTVAHELFDAWRHKPRSKPASPKQAPVPAKTDATKDEPPPPSAPPPSAPKITTNSSARSRKEQRAARRKG